MTDFPIQTDPNRKLYEHIDGHPSHTPPNAPQGPAWWRKKGGWDRFAASVLEQSKYLGRMTKLLEQMTNRYVNGFRQHEQNVRRRIDEMKVEIKEFKVIIKQFNRKHAELMAKVREVEDAMKRGALALTPQHWEALQRQERYKLERAEKKTL